jgi:integrase
MVRVGRNRTKHKRMLKGWTPIGKSVYFVPTCAADLAIVLQATGGKKSLRLGALADHNECAKTYAEVIVAARVARDDAEPGTVGELVLLARRDILPTIESPKTRSERLRHWAELERLFGAKPYARSIHEAAIAPRKYFSALDVQGYIDASAETRPVAANRAVDSWALVFAWARNRWGRTEYNPCRGIDKNDEDARDVLPEHIELYRGVRDAMPRGIYRQLAPPARFILNMYRYYGRRRGETLRLTLTDIQHDDGLHMLRGKERQSRGSKKKGPRKPRVLIIPWEPRLRKMLARVLRWRAAKVREALPTTALLVNRDGRPYSEDAAKSAWRRGMERSGQKGQFVQHDVRATRADTLPEDVAIDVLAHDSPDMVRRVYRNRGPKVIDFKGNK